MAPANKPTIDTIAQTEKAFVAPEETPAHPINRIPPESAGILPNGRTWRYFNTDPTRPFSRGYGGVPVENYGTRPSTT